MNQEHSLLIQEYAKHPLKNAPLVHPTISRHEGNFICGDDITVDLLIVDDILVDYGYSGNCSTITSAAASFLSEFIIGNSLDDILTRNYLTMQNRGFEVSPRRRRAATIAILAVRNAIHLYKKDKKEDVFDDVIE